MRRSSDKKGNVAAVGTVALCALSALLIPSLVVAEEPPRPPLSVAEVYKKHITDSKSGYLTLRGAFALGGGQLLLESDDHRLFMCDSETGNILWTHSVGELASDKAWVNPLHKDPYVLGACLDGDALGLLLVLENLHAEYVTYNRLQNTVHRLDLSKVMTAQNASIRRIEIKDSRVLVPQGLWFDTTMALIDLKTGGLIRRLTGR